MSTQALAIEIATILLGAGFAGALVLYAGPRGWLGHPHQRVSVSSLAYSAFSSGSVESSVTQAVSPPEPAEEVSPSPATAPFQTVRPHTTAPPALGVSSMTSFGASETQKAPRTYRRRTTPPRSPTKGARRTRHR